MLHVFTSSWLEFDVSSSSLSVFTMFRRQLAPEVEDAKPKCGGGQVAGDYDIPLHVAGLCKSPMHHRSRRITQLTFC